VLYFGGEDVYGQGNVELNWTLGVEEYVPNEARLSSPSLVRFITMVPESAPEHNKKTRNDSSVTQSAENESRPIIIPGQDTRGRLKAMTSSISTVIAILNIDDETMLSVASDYK
jgi:hypothetical protein